MFVFYFFFFVISFHIYLKIRDVLGSKNSVSYDAMPCHDDWMNALSLLFLFLKKLIIFSLRRKVYCLITLFLQSAIRTQHYNPCQCLIMLDFPIHVGYSEYMLSIDLCLLGAKAKLTWLILLGGLFFWTREVDYLVLVVPRRYQNDLANGLRIFYASEQHIRHYS